GNRNRGPVRAGHIPILDALRPVASSPANGRTNVGDPLRVTETRWKARKARPARGPPRTAAGDNISAVTSRNTDLIRGALTSLSEDEVLFRDSVYEFADREIRPLVREMDEHARIAPGLIDKLFDLGVMGIEIPDSF